MSGGCGGANVREQPAGHALAHTRLVEVLRDPTHEEGPARAQEQAGVDVRRLCDDPFFEQVPRLSTYERPKRKGFIKVVADPERRVLKGAVAAGPESGEWLQQLTLAIRAETPIDVLLDVIQPYPTFSEGVFWALRELNLDV